MKEDAVGVGFYVPEHYPDRKYPEDASLHDRRAARRR